MFKKATLFLVIVMIIVSLSGCASITPNMNEINKLDMVRIVGVDIDPKQPNNIRLTILSKKQSPSSQGQSNQSSGGEQPPESEIVSGSAATLFEAERSLQTSSDKQMFWGHGRTILGRYLNTYLANFSIPLIANNKLAIKNTSIQVDVKAYL